MEDTVQDCDDLDSMVKIEDRADCYAKNNQLLKIKLQYQALKEKYDQEQAHLVILIWNKNLGLPIKKSTYQILT